MLSRAEDTFVLAGAFACEAGDAHHPVGCFGFPHPHLVLLGQWLVGVFPILNWVGHKQVSFLPVYPSGKQASSSSKLPKFRLLGEKPTLGACLGEEFPPCSK